MTFKTIAAAMALTLAAAPGFAAGTGHADNMKMSRIEVHADMVPAVDAHLSRGEAYGTVVPMSTMARADVLAELQLARAAGRIVSGSESYGSFGGSDFVSTQSRAPVMARASKLDRQHHLYGGA